jgi:hypothetical protein
LKPLKKITYPLFAGLFILFALYLSYSYGVQTGSRQSANWMGPFLSGAQHLKWGGEFLIDLQDSHQFKDLDNVVSEDWYRFKQNTSPQKHISDPIGYVYLIKLATLLFPWSGHQLAIILLQSLMHLILCLVVLREQTLSVRSRLLFFILYALNPLVLRFVTFNHYYFWQVLPSFFLLFFWLRVNSRIGYALVSALLPFVLLLRPTTLLAVLACFGSLLYLRHSRKYGLLYSLLSAGLLVWLFTPNQKNPWHSMYAGIGAYANPYDIKLSDNSAYELYQKRTGRVLNAEIGGNFFDPQVQGQYQEITRGAYLDVLQNSPLLLIKNALVNYLQAFSIGYLNKAPDWFNYLIALSGAGFMSLLLYYRKYRLVGFMTLTVIGFVPYYPPIQAYMYGNYLLLVWGLIEVFHESSLFRASWLRNRIPV